MSHFQRILAHPIFSRWFARVLPIFWPVLYWQMERHFRWMKETGHMDLLVRIEWWGGITIVYCGDKSPDPSAYRAYIPERPRWDDPVWASGLPAIASDLQDLAGWHALIRPCASGGGSVSHREMSEGALRATPNTS